MIDENEKREYYVDYVPRDMSDRGIDMLLIVIRLYGL